MDKQNEKARENELMELTPDQMDKVSGGVELEDISDRNNQASTQRRESHFEGIDEYETPL